MNHTQDMLLRPVEERDLELLLQWRNSERIRANMYTTHLITREEHLGWFERLAREKASYAFLFEAAGRRLGVVNLNRFDWGNRRCHWGFYLGEPDAPPGSGTRMAYLALCHIFEELKLHKVIGEALAFNQASIAYHQKLGFTQEGRYAEHVLRDDAWVDVLSFALLGRDWPRVKREIEKRIQGA